MPVLWLPLSTTRSILAPGRFDEREIKYGKLELWNCIELPLPLWSASEGGSAGRLFVQACPFFPL